MRVASGCVLIPLAAGFMVLTGCESANHTLSRLSPSAEEPAPPALSANAPATPAASNSTPSSAETTGSISAALDKSLANEAPALEADDDLSLAKRQFRESNYGLAELHFRRAVEKAPQGTSRRDAEGWLGLAATYDRLRRFELADRAYSQALRILGPTPELLNNYGYSYLLRGDYRRARVKLLLAREKDPNNPYIQHNIQLLEKNSPKAGR